MRFKGAPAKVKSFSVFYTGTFCCRFVFVNFLSAKNETFFSYGANSTFK